MTDLDRTILWVSEKGWESCRKELFAVIEGALSNEIPTPYDGLATQAGLEVIRCKAARVTDKSDEALEDLICAKRELHRARDLRLHWLSMRGHRGPYDEN